MMNKKTAPVGVFDSGVGGLTVAREISRQLPDENIVYFGDTARVPYGSKSQNTIIRFSEQIIRFLKTKEVKAIVIACNTASALALDAVKDEFDIPILGVVIPAYETAMDLKCLLEENDMANDGTEGQHSNYSFYVSDAAEKFRKFANTVMPFDVPITNVVNIEGY